MHNPVQIILDPQSFIFNPKRTPGGSYKDFYVDRDQAFLVHKSKLVNHAVEISKVLQNAPYGPLSVLKVNLLSDALAKSHHPVNSIFKDNIAPELGAGDLCSLHFQVDHTVLLSVANQINSTSAPIISASSKLS